MNTTPQTTALQRRKKDLPKIEVDERMDLPSASAAERLANCPASWLLSKQCPTPASTEYAERGTRIHAANETGNIDGLAEEEADMVRSLRQAEEAIFNAWIEEYDITDAKIFREKRFWLREGGVPIFSAKLDFYAISESQSRVLVLDSKSGRKEVQPPVTNWQLRSALVCLHANYFLVSGRVGIVQPLSKQQPLCDYDLESLAKSWDCLEAMLASLKKINQKPIPGAWCEFCPAKSICPAAREYVEFFAGLKGMRWEAVSADQKLGMWDKASVAEKIIKDIKANIKANLKDNPECVPGLVRGDDTESRKIVEPVGVYTELKKEIEDLKADEFTKLCSLALGKVKEFYREKKQASDAEAEAFLAKCEHSIKREHREGIVRRVK